jgi:UDP:flavonoid glycosyltransferase YjiC (YdhE family)
MALADLVIFHGGAGTGYQAISVGTPAIVVATHLEQEFVGQVLEEHGAGIFWTMNQVMVAPSLIRSSVETMLKNLAWHRSNMDRLRQDFLLYNPVQTAADCIESFVVGRLHIS